MSLPTPSLPSDVMLGLLLAIALAVLGLWLDYRAWQVRVRRIRLERQHQRRRAKRAQELERRPSELELSIMRVTLAFREIARAFGGQPK